MDIKNLKSVIKIFQDSELAELTLESDGEKIRLKKYPSLSTQAVYHSIPSTPASPPALNDKSLTEKSSEKGPTAHYIRSPFVGTFYRSPSPDSKPYVEIGSRVKVGQTLCIVEAMKLMNEIECDKNGIIKNIFIENGVPVEYGESLFEIDSE